MNKFNIKMIKITPGDQNKLIQIMSSRGLELQREAMNTVNKQDSPAPDQSMIRKIFSIKVEFIDITVSSLSMMKKWYIESRLLR